MANPFVFVGLGNPGQKYAETRHNAGFWFLDRLASQSEAVFRLQSKLHVETAKAVLHGQECILVKPTTFMNHSGQAVRAVLDYYKVPCDRLLIAYDELDLPPGPELGRVLDHLLERVLDEPEHNNRETLLTWARSYLERNWSLVAAAVLGTVAAVGG